MRPHVMTMRPPRRARSSWTALLLLALVAGAGAWFASGAVRTEASGGGIFAWNSTTYNVTEGGAIQIRVDRAGGGGNTGTATLTFGGGTTTAVASVDYTAPGSNVLNFGTSDTFKTLTLQTLVNPAIGVRVLEVTITGVDSGDTIASPPANKTTITINQAPAPTVTSITPNSGSQSGGTVVTITGTNLGGATAATIGGSACNGIENNTPTSLDCTTSPHAAGAADVVVTTPGGTSPSGNGLFTYLSVSNSSFFFGNSNCSSPLSAQSAAEGNVVTIYVCRSGAISQDGHNVDLRIGQVGDTAVSPTDYSPSGQFGKTFGANINVASHNITLQTRPGDQGNRTITLTLLNPVVSGDVIGTPGTQVLTITDTAGPQAPTITGISPHSGPTAGGTTVTITGTNFTGTTCANVKFGAVPAASCPTIGATSIQAVSPAGSGIVGINVNNGTGTSPDTAADDFSYGAGPVIYSISPATGTGGTTVTITGAGFLPGPTVAFGAAPATIVGSPTNTSMTVTAPAGSGTVRVAVSNANGSSPDTVDDDFAYTGQTTITTVVPASGPQAGANQVTINGSNFQQGSTSVTFGGVAATNIQVAGGGNSLTCTVPASGATGPVNVVVTAPAGAATKTNGYTYQTNTGPIVTGLSPNAGGLGGGTLVTITGANFASGATVTFGGTAASAVTFVSATQLTATAPPHALGVVDVIVTVSGVQSPNTPDDDFTYNGNLPTITGITPGGGPTAGGTVVTISGTNFIGTVTVDFGGAAGTNVQVNAQQNGLTVTAPAHAAGLVNIRVTTAAGTSPDTTADDYLYGNAPVVNSVTRLVSGSPVSSSPAGQTTLGVTIKGINFTGATQVKFGDATAVFNVVDDTTINTAAPGSVPAGIVDVTVTGPGGTSNTSATTKWEFTGSGGPLPTITGLNPTSAPTNTTPQVVITGTNFTSPATVKFGDTAATNIVVNSATQITVTAPSRANTGTVEVVVTTNAGASPTAGTANDFSYTAGGGTVTYQLFFRWTLIVWTGKANTNILTLLQGVESPTDNPATNNVSSQVTAMYRWSPSGAGCPAGTPQCWLAFFPSGVGVPGANDFSTLDTGQAYWVAINGPGNISWVTLTGP